ncbi:secretory subunit [Borealophlyctis nickersoniae]|nr:secretory subunit [Borealophlyctis nickersoniae]
MAQYKYDETGAIFNYFLLTVLAIVLLPTTISRLTGGKKAKLDKNACQCDGCQEKRRRIAALKRKNEPAISVRSILLILGWLFFVFVVYKVATTTIDEPALWDPYEILGLEKGVDASAVKKAFRELSKQYHPDKLLHLTDEERKGLEQKYVDITKASKVLTDDDARANYEEFGHPDGKQATTLGLALPKWLVDESNSLWVLGLYTAVFMIALPMLVAQWWGNAKNMTKDKIMHPTMARFYREMKDHMPFKALVDLLSKADEFHTLISLEKSDIAALEQVQDDIKTEMESKTTDRWEKKKTVPKDAASALALKVSILLYAHLLRVKPADPKLAEEQILVVDKSVHLVGGMLQIAMSRGWMATAMVVLDLSQMITQGMYFRQVPLAQLPWSDYSIFKHFNTKKRKILTIRDLLELEPEDRRLLLRSIPSEEQDKVILVAKQYPVIKITKAKFSVLGEPAIIPEAVVTLTVKLALVDPDKLPEESKLPPVDLSKDDGKDDEEEPKDEWWKPKNSGMPDAHAPYFPGSKKPVWWVMMGDMKQNRLIVMGKSSDLIEESTVRLQFQAPPKPGTWAFQIFVKSDTYVGCDAMTEVKLHVQPPEAAPLIDEDDDISEPEEDSIAGQMQAMRTGGGGGKKGENEDSSDSESEDEVAGSGGHRHGPGCSH